MSLFAGGVLSIGDSEVLSELIEKSLFIGTVLILSLAVLMKQKRHQFSRRIILGAGICIAGFAPAVITTSVQLLGVDSQIAIGLLRVVFICCWLLYVINVDWKSHPLWIALLFSGLIVTGLNLVIWIKQGRPIPFLGLTPQKNVLATVGFCGTFIGTLGIIQNKERLILYLASGMLLLNSLIVVYASGGRKSLLGIIVSAGAYWGWQFIRTYAWLTTIVFLAVCAGCYIVVPIYLNLEDMPFFWVLDDFLLSSQNQDIYTGREVVWPDVMSLISQRPWFGHGGDYTCFIGRLSERTEKGLSAHNQALAILYRSGISGLAGMGIFLWAVWSCLCRLGQNQNARLSTAFMLGIIVTQYFTVSLMQNLFVGLGLWTIIASGIAGGFAGGFAASAQSTQSTSGRQGREITMAPYLTVQIKRGS